MNVLSYPAEQVRRYDHDRFLTAIFAPDPTREDLFALYAFNIEIAKTGEVVSDALIGRIRLQWWRDALDRLYAGDEIAHQIARPLGQAIRIHGLPRTDFERLIDAREFDLDRAPPATMAAMLGYAEETGGLLLELALRIASPGGFDCELLCKPARLVGGAWALTGLLRAIPFHARQRRLYLPADGIAAAGVRISRLFELVAPVELRGVVHSVAAEAAARLAKARPLVKTIPRQARSPLLLADLAHVYLNDLRRAAWDSFVLEQRPARRLMAARLGISALLKNW